MNLKNNEIFVEADRLSDLGRHEEALDFFIQLAEWGDEKAMSRLAIIYSDGLGVEKNIDESIKWDLLAINAGDIASLANLALTFCGQREFRDARYWFERAVAVGDGDAALELAKLLYVSDLEKENVKRLLVIAVNSSSITQDSLEKAKVFLDLIESDKK